MTQSWTTLCTETVVGGEAELSKSDQDQLRLDLPAGYAVLEVRTFGFATQIRLALVTQRSS